MNWGRAQKALRAEVRRVVALIRSVEHPGAPALGEWSLAEVAVHLSQAWIAVPGLARADLTDIRAVLPSQKDAPGDALIRDVWNLGDVTREGVDSEPERNLDVVAARIDARASEYLDGIGRGAGDDLRTWLVEGVEVGLSTLTCHLLNETVVHGWDIAKADGRPWEISKPHAAMVFDGFVVPVLQRLGPRDMVDQEAAAGLQATYEIRVRGGGRHVFAFDDGALTIEAPSSRPVDCIVTAADPSALLLVVWKRITQNRAIVERRLVASGPKAWLATRLPSLMRSP